MQKNIPHPSPVLDDQGNIHTQRMLNGLFIHFSKILVLRYHDIHNAAGNYADDHENDNADDKNGGDNK